MNDALRAPVLSATSSIDRTWSMALSSRESLTHSRPGDLGDLVDLLRLPQHLHQAPPLRLAERTRLHDQDPVAHARLLFLIVDVILLRARDHLLVPGMRRAPF